MVHVAVLGAGGGIGQPLSLLLKLRLPAGSILSLYDLANAAGVAADLSHINTPVKVKWAAGTLPPVADDPELAKLAVGVDIFVLLSGAAQKPGMSRDDLFKVNADICMNMIRTCGKAAPGAMFCVVTNPVNSTVPIAAQTLRKLGVYDKNKLFGVSALDVMRATAFLNEIRAPHCVSSVPVVGGHGEGTIIPLYSQVPGVPIKEETLTDIVKRTQNGAAEVIVAKAGRGSATLSMAEAGARFTMALVNSLMGVPQPTMYAYVDTDGTHKLPFFAIPLVLGKGGIEKRLPIGPTSAAERKMLDTAEQLVEKSIATGESFARSKL